MVIEGLFVLPHGDNILDPSSQPIEYRTEEQLLHNAAVRLVQE